MATLSQANQAREEHAERLRRLGAHSVGVDKVALGKTKTFAVVAWLPEAKAGLPESLEINWKNGTKKVPLITKIAAPFKPQSLL
ncbi:MAG TPA: hypothetical protein VHK91_10140 [Flavisolibacter sp.]|jgi:hypothetical protein|nr:hypothetical protein [Flavisolibacter sp.]